MLSQPAQNLSQTINDSFPIQENKALDTQGGLGWVVVSLLCLFDWFSSSAEWKFKTPMGYTGAPRFLCLQHLGYTWTYF